jgi:hypothetical protein
MAEKNILQRIVGALKGGSATEQPAPEEKKPEAEPQGQDAKTKQGDLPFTG